MNGKDQFTSFIARIRAGDHTAAEELVRDYEPIVRREIRLRMTDQRLLAMFDSVDICQSVWTSFFVRVSAGQYDLESPNQLMNLLVAIAKNKLAFQSRRNRYQKRDVRRLERSEVVIESVSDRQPGPGETLAAKELFARVLQNLSDEERKISELRRNGLAWEDVATALGGTGQSRRMQLNRAADRVIRLLGLE